jgi:hypothetical protein
MLDEEQIAAAEARRVEPARLEGLLFLRFGLAESGVGARIDPPSQKIVAHGGR